MLGATTDKLPFVGRARWLRWASMTGDDSATTTPNAPQEADAPWPDPPVVDSVYLAACLELDAVEARLLTVLERLTDDNAREPSRLPGWTRGHLATHLARGAEAVARVSEGLIANEPRAAYASEEKRDADIEAGSAREPAALVADVAASALRLRAVVASLGAAGTDVLDREVPVRGSVLTGWQIPLRRVREIELHAVDLDLGREPHDWSQQFVERTLDDISRDVRRRADSTVAELRDTSGRSWQLGGDGGPTVVGPSHALLAWLTGRGNDPALRVEPEGNLPAPPAWT